MSCPESMDREATAPNGTDVHFESPVPTGGVPPYTVQCEPGSGSTFPVGESTVRCTAVDSAAGQATCEFAVRVRVSQTLARTKYVAFGDSITEGATSLVPLIMLGAPDTYPFKLEQGLMQRYPTQAITVSNQGVGGETTVQGARRRETGGSAPAGGRQRGVAVVDIHAGQQPAKHDFGRPETRRRGHHCHGHAGQP